MQASMASGVVDICLIPEVRFTLEGRQGLLAYLETVLEQRGHAVICLAEGAGQASRLSFELRQENATRIVAEYLLWPLRQENLLLGLKDLYMENVVEESSGMKWTWVQSLPFKGFLTDWLWQEASQGSWAIYIAGKFTFQSFVWEVL